MNYFFRNNQLLHTNTTKIFLRGIVLFTAACICFLQSNAQTKNDNPLQLADASFAAGDFYTAAKLYEQFLNPSKKLQTKSDFPLNSKRNRQQTVTTKKSRTDIMFQQAESYRLANYFKEAAELYKACFTKDAVKYVDAYYWYAVCERSIGNYKVAQESINQYQASAGSMYKVAAEKETETLQYILQQLARPDSVLYTIKKLNSPTSVEKGIFAPAFLNSNHFIITSTEKANLSNNRINPFHSRLFSAVLNEGSLESITPVTITAIDSTKNQGAASLSANGKHLYFTEWTKQNGQTVSSIYHTTKNETGWSKPSLLAAVNVDGYNSKQPFCTSDGKYLYFSSNRPGGTGNYDIWVATIHDDGTVTEPVNAGPVINTTNDEQAPFYHSNQSTLVFSTNGRTGMGGFDLFTTKGSMNAWSTPQNMGHPVNSARDDAYFFVSEKTNLLQNALLSSDRGSECCLETYIVTKAPKKRNLTGLIRDLTTGEPVANAEITLKDATGKKWKQITGTDGSYIFNLENEGANSFTITKEYYKEKNTPSQIETTNEQDWLTDVLKNKDEFIEKRVILKPETVVTVYFDFDKYNLTDSATSKLDSVFRVLSETTGATLQISGYTDGKGTVAYNKVLSDRRARATANYLIQKGIDSSRITFESFGACCPIEMEFINGLDNEAGRAKNRRALINVVMPKQE